jgi:type II secretory ATPase GspE/PulE/Tfp pilus assembly ATPase PilB-like protein
MNREVLTAPNMLTLLVYQALVPKLCPQCAMTSEEGAANTPDVSGVVKHIDGLGLDRQNFKWRRMGGCEVCKNRGTVGLTVVAEMIMPDDEWLKLIRENRDTEAVAHYRSMSNRDLTSPNMDGKTAFEHTLYKALQGEVDARQCSRFDVWARYVKNNRRPAIALVA